MATEAVVRRRLRDELLAATEDRAEALYEFWVPQSNERADVVVIERAMAGYEIKTERDTLKRLPRQSAAYARLFDTCTLVTAERHLPSAMEIVPEWWGIIAYLNGDCPPEFRSVRAATANATVDSETLVRLLWRDEVRAVLLTLGDEPDPRASRASMWQRLLALIDLPHLKEVVRSALLGRDPTAARLPTRRFSTTTALSS